jgi:carboxyl-terminal processing protease
MQIPERSMLRTLFRPATLAMLALVLASCGGSGGGGDCGVEAEKRFVLDVVDEWYLFQEDLPSSIDPDDYATADDLLDALTAEARAEGKDRFFSFLTSAQEEDAFFGEGETIAFGFITQLLPGDDSQHFRLFVAKVEPGSPADTAGFDRGDEILAIGPDPQHLTPIDSISGSEAEVRNEISFLFGPFQTGVTRSFEVAPIEGGADVIRTMTKQVITLDPVPTTGIFTRQGTTPIGYVALDTFISPAEDQLRGAFASFKAENVRDIVVDLRYNGGGLIVVGELLANLLAADLVGETMYRILFNANHPEENEDVPFAAEPQAIVGLRIAFITTEGSASASELVINSLEPYAEVAIVGSPTFGKPVGQAGFRMDDCDTVLRLVAFETVNADNEGGYFNGLPTSQFSGDFCPAEDDLLAERGDPDEDSTATALFWVNNGVCPSSAKALTAPKILVPRLAKPRLAQEQLPGLF